MSKYWLVDATGNKALVEGDDERDRFLPHGWALAEAPSGGEFVWARCEGVADPARFPADNLEAWEAKGWKPGAPPHPLDGLVAPAAVPAADKPTKTTAAGGTAKGN
jgi:hypothetical protein